MNPNYSISYLGKAGKTEAGLSRKYQGRGVVYFSPSQELEISHPLPSFPSFLLPPTLSLSLPPSVALSTSPDLSAHPQVGRGRGCPRQKKVLNRKVERDFTSLPYKNLTLGMVTVLRTLRFLFYSFIHSP